ncbi:hypothetical protein KM043_012961 [Ampulex compressa]|nr:hypothetical protein KM043_012961 [Ampulex compressa]
MAPKLIVCLLLTCGIFSLTTSVSLNQKPLQDNQLHHEHATTRGASSASCPEKNGRFPVSSQCDAYIECIDGVPEHKLCPEGLLFNPDARFNYPCGYPIDVDCTGRPERQPAQPTDDCPHQYGYFKVGDSHHCGQFMNCADGRGYIFDCPEGLAFNAETYRCDWPDQVPDCDAEAFLGFRCPDFKDSPFHGAEIRFYRSNADCQHYYICVNERPRLLNCGEGNAFNEVTETCEAAENVTGCEPLDYQTKNTPTKLF